MAKPDNARGGGQDASKLDESLVKVQTSITVEQRCCSTKTGLPASG